MFRWSLMVLFATYMCCLLLVRAVFLKLTKPPLPWKFSNLYTPILVHKCSAIVSHSKESKESWEFLQCFDIKEMSGYSIVFLYILTCFIFHIYWSCSHCYYISQSEETHESHLTVRLLMAEWLATCRERVCHSGGVTVIYLWQAKCASATADMS